MAVTYSAAVKNARMDAVLTEIGNAGKVWRGKARPGSAG